MIGFFAPVPGSGSDPDPKPPHDAQRRRDPRSAPPRVRNLHLESVGADIAPRFLTESPEAAALVVDDLCWQAAIADWEHRRPSWWRTRARTAWRAEGAELAVLADRLRDRADAVLRDL